MSIEEIEKGIKKLESEPYSWKGQFKLKILKIALEKAKQSK